MCVPVRVCKGDHDRGGKWGKKTLIAEVAQHCNSEIFNSISVNRPTIFFSHVKEKCSQALQTFLFWFKKKLFYFIFF